ncbi:MAG: hypothetical protein A2287_02925 [Candidatus Melainabacteria bacterium RIFOXYA12_FULL_32_12]|nr:MAG: hypothetical protein A2255_06775 [Candidatus Melainabacteria bacterium RIFOXYA2_FULL_32_9]OGI29336.1 MAG: hypothetical protein A2287_02925 [Candidatus Melainabacteria bacterium RIFOXYA12_FULL_32_12]
MESLSLGKVLNILRKNFKIILLFSIIGLMIGVFYAVAIFKPMYKSTAKLLIKNNTQTEYVTALGTANDLTPLTRNGNPALTQMQILTSGVLSDKVWQTISAKYKFHDDPKVGAKLMQKAINVQNPVGTDIIEITASWSDPKIAKDVASEFAAAYIANNVDQSKKGLVQSQETINNQLSNAETNLATVREKIRQFRQAASTINLEVESASIVGQLSDLENRYHEIVASAGAEGNRVASISGKLGIDWHKAINSVALGHNANITALQTRLGEAQEELSGLNTKYAPTHPSIIALNSRISQIKSELADQIRQTVGGSLENAEEILISDPVRTSMMESLVSSEATYRGLLAQSGVLSSAIDTLKAIKSSIPNKQLVLSHLLQEEANLALIVNTLKAKQLETGIRESGIVSNINVIDNPIVPLYAAFPGRTQTAGLFGILGALLGIVSVMVMYLTKDTYDEVEQIEEELKAPVLGVIPWLDKQTYNEPNALLAIDDNASYYSLAYQRVVSSLRIRGYNSGAKSFVFSSTEFSKSRSTVLMNIAYGLSRAGRSVIVLDADFRTPSIHKEFGLKPNEQFSLAELLTSITKEVKETGEFNWRYLSYFIHELSEAPNLCIIPNTANISDPNEFLYSPAFNILVQKLKEQYDWVLVDTPPALAVSDAVTTSSYVDGVILISGLETTKSALRKVNRLLNNYHIPIFGIVAREVQNSEAVLSNEYIKQIISNMMPQEESTLVKK